MLQRGPKASYAVIRSVKACIPVLIKISLALMAKGVKANLGGVKYHDPGREFLCHRLNIHSPL